MRLNYTWPTKNIEFKDKIVKKSFTDDLKDSSFTRFVDNYKLIGIKLIEVNYNKKIIWYEFQEGSRLPVYDFDNEDIKSLYKLVIPQLMKKLSSIKPYIHYDLSPENILVDNKIVKIIDPDSILLVNEDRWEFEYYKSLQYLLLRCVELKITKIILYNFEDIINQELIKSKNFGDDLGINMYFSKNDSLNNFKKILISRYDNIFDVLVTTLGKNKNNISLYNIYNKEENINENE